MSINDSKGKNNQGMVDTAIDTIMKPSGADPAMQKHLEVLRKRVLDMLKASDPVCGIYAMYGAHEK